MFVAPDFFYPPCLSAVQFLLCHEGGKTLMISVDDGFSAFKVTSPFSECFHKGIEFLFPGWVPEDRVRVFSGEEADGVKFGIR